MQHDLAGRRHDGPGNGPEIPRAHRSVDFPSVFPARKEIGKSIPTPTGKWFPPLFALLRHPAFFTTSLGTSLFSCISSHDREPP